MAKIKLDSICVDCPDPAALATFYGDLLEVEVKDEAIQLDGFEVWFQPVENYQAPTWPSQERGQQIHFDFHTDDREGDVMRAVQLGATETGEVHDGFTVLLDPAGHPFCICDSN